MTVEQVMNALKDAPPKMDVFIYQTNTEHSHSLVEMCMQQVLEFKDGNLKASAPCIVITDEL